MNFYRQMKKIKEREGGRREGGGRERECTNICEGVENIRKTKRKDEREIKKIRMREQKNGRIMERGAS